MEKIIKFGVMLIFLLFGCDGTKVVGSIECGESQIDVMSIKNERNTLNGHTWSRGIRYGDVTLRLNSMPYPGHFSSSFKTQMTGTRAFPEFGMYGFPHGDAIQFFMGEFAAKPRKVLTKCLVEHDKSLRALLLKTKTMQQFPPRGDFDTRFVFWDAKEKDLKLTFEADGGDEYLTLSLSNAIFFHKKSTKQLMKVGELQWAKDGKTLQI